VRLVAERVWAEGATELLTSYVPKDGGPAGLYQRLGFVPTGELDGTARSSCVSRFLDGLCWPSAGMSR
jgi:hypothetical protein